MPKDDDPTVMDHLVIMNDAHQVTYWTGYFNVPREEIELVVKEVGTRVDDVQRALVSRKGKITRGRW